MEGVVFKMPLGMGEGFGDMIERVGDEGTPKTDLEMFAQGLEWALRMARKGTLKGLE